MARQYISSSVTADMLTANEQARAAGLTFKQTRRDNLIDYVAALPTSVLPDPYCGGVDRCTMAVVWYDRIERLWTGWLADDHGYQFTEAVYGVNTDDVAAEVARLYRTRLP